MPYHKNKQQSFQAAQQAFVQAQQAASDLQPYDEDFGHHYKLAQKEVNEAEQVIHKALFNASEHQRNELEKFSQELNSIKSQLDQYS
ncbi:MAG: hypothetical protein LRY71_04670 [Bacillaceae bacterium]|nr:hypothetical protein [Bacillaceae bacterium]